MYTLSWPHEVPTLHSCFRERQTLPNSVPFDGTTTNQDDFDRKHIPERESFAPKRALPVDIKFDGDSTYHDTFDRKEIPERVAR